MRNGFIVVAPPQTVVAADKASSKQNNQRKARRRKRRRKSAKMNAKGLAFVLYAVLMIGDGSGLTTEESSKQRWKRSSVPAFNDPLYPDQFYLNDRFGVTMNIKKAWSKGYTGKNVTICINDPSGIEYKHGDLLPRFKLMGSYNFDDNKVDPSPPPKAPSMGGSHGTQMGGLAGAQANNRKCGVGVAYDAYISGVRLIRNDSRDNTQSVADSLVYGNQINDIYSCSWGPIDFLATEVGYVPIVSKVSLRNGAEKGRGGKGNIYVFANGNEGLSGNGTCSYNEFVSSIYTISISVVTGKNKKSRQNVPCTGVSAVAYGRDGDAGVFYPHDLMPTCGINNTCIRTSGSSSAAAAVASGIFALVLQANPNLGWRDLQHLIARSSSSGFPSVPWKTNKAGIRVSDVFGFGLLDADALIENAKGWTNVGQHLECVLDYRLNQQIDGVDTIVKSIDLSSWPASCGGNSQRINFLEHVLLVVSFNYTYRSEIEIEIEAPTGTKSVILRSGRFMDPGREVKDLSVLSLHHWGENPKGTWTMRVRSVNPNAKNSGGLYRWGFKFYGTRDDPLASNTIKPSQIRRSFTNTTSGPPVTPTNAASQSTSGASPTVSGVWSIPNATTNTINATTGHMRKVPTTTKNGSESALKSCKSTYLAATILVLSLFWKMNC